MCGFTHDLQTPSILQIVTFSKAPPSSALKYFMHGRKTFIKRHSVILRRSRPKL